MAHEGAGVKGLTFCASRVAVGVFSPEMGVNEKYMVGISRAGHNDAGGIEDLQRLRSAFIVTPQQRKNHPIRGHMGATPPSAAALCAKAQPREHRIINPRWELTGCASFRRSSARAR